MNINKYIDPIQNLFKKKLKLWHDLFVLKPISIVKVPCTKTKS